MSVEDTFAIARNCSDPAIAPLVGSFCMSIPASTLPLTDPVVLVERAYLQRDALTGPAYSELLMPTGFLVQLG